MRWQGIIQWMNITEYRRCRFVPVIHGKNFRKKIGRLSWNVQKNLHDMSVNSGQRERESKEFVMSHGTEVVELTAEERKRFRNAVMGVYEKYCGDSMDVIEKITAEGAVQ